jgi:Mg-chelatase subunit ChlD
VAQTTNTAGGEQSGKSAAATVDQKTTDAALESVIGLSASGRIQEAVEQLRGLKAAAEPQLQSVAFLQLLAAASEGTGSMDWDAARNVLESRQAIEESIFSAGLLTPLASSTMRRVVEAADLIQRQQEDAVLAAGQIRLSTATGTPKSLELQSENLVQVVAEIVSAVRTRDRWIQRAPFLLRLACVRSPLHSTEQTLTPEWIRRTLQSALQEITELDRLLRQTAAEAELAVSAPQRQAVERIVQALQQKELLLDGLLQREADALSRLPDMAPGEGELQSGMAGAHWRQLDQFLMLPFLADRAMEPNAAAARRVRFLQDLIRIQRLTDNFDAVSSGADVSHPPENRRPESLLTLGLSYYATAALPGGTPGLSSECPASGAVLQRLIQDRVAAITQLAHGESATQRVDQLVNVGESLRLFPAHLAQHLFKITQQFPSYRSRELLTADLHLWLAQRISDDFWGIPLGDGEFWFHAVAKECLRSACRHAVGMSGFLEKAEADLQRRLQAAQDFPGLRSSPLRVSLSESRLVGSDQIRALLEVNPAASLPSGNLRLSLRSPADNGLTFNTSLLTEGEREQAEILITRGRPVALSTPVTIHAFLRGHQSFVPLNFSAVGEVDRPGISWQANHATGGELVVNWSKVTPKPMTILFVLDCSRSMNAEGRITILRDSLLRFSDYARHTGVRVGLRVFGDSAVWRIGDRESELKARKDSRLLVPVQPFPEQQFRTSVASLRAFGETPLFHAIQESIQDFPAAERGEKMIVVVSDGADNWAGTPGAPTLANLAEQLTSNSIQCNAIGFRTDAVGFDQLSQLASLTNGMAVRAEDGGQLIQQIMGMTEALECSVYQRNGTQRIRVQQRSLESETVFHVDAGDLIYDLEVTDYSDHVKAVHTGIRMRPGQRHSLNWNGATLAYAAPPLAQDVVFTEHPGNGMLLRVMKTETLPGNRLRLNIALQNRLQPDWWPVDARIVVRPNNSNHLYVLRTLPQNLAGCHFPAWDVTLEHWPADSQSAQIIANWSGQNADPKTHPVQALPLTDALSAPIALDELSHITRASAGLLSWNSSPSPVARITVVNRTSPDAVLGWGVRTDDPPDSVWSVHDTADGLSAIILRFAPGDSPKSFNVLPPLPDDPDHTLQLSLQLKLQQIN